MAGCEYLLHLLLSGFGLFKVKRANRNSLLIWSSSNKQIKQKYHSLDIPVQENLQKMTEETVSLKLRTNLQYLSWLKSIILVVYAVYVVYAATSVVKNVKDVWKWQLHQSFD